MRESKVERHLVARVERAGGVAMKFTSPGLRGVPDRIVVLPHVNGPRIFFVEVKAPGESPRPSQTRVHSLLRQIGAVVYVADSIEAVDTLLNVLGV